MYMFILLFVLVISGDSSDLCKCPKKPEKMIWIQLCGNKIHKDCKQEAIYACDYTLGGSNISVFEDCEKYPKLRCTPRSCLKSAEASGVCRNHSCS